MSLINARPNRPGSKKAGILSSWQLYVMLLIPVIFVLVFNYAPMVGVVIAFEDYKILKGPFASPLVGLKYFRQFFSAANSGPIIWNTVTLSLYSIIAGFPFPILLAIMLNEARSAKFRKTVQMATYAPYFISTVVLVSMLFTFLDPSTGIITRFLTLFGVQPEPFTGDQNLVQPLYVWSGVWQGTGYGAVLYLAALTSVPQELYEASRIDGANK